MGHNAAEPCRQCCIIGQSMERWANFHATRALDDGAVPLIVSSSNTLYLATLDEAPRREFSKWHQYKDHAVYNTPFIKHKIDPVSLHKQILSLYSILKFFTNT
jgi:hypothetical protein